MRFGDRPARRSIVVDGRMIHQDQCHGIARVTIELLRHAPADWDRPVVLLMGEGRRSDRFDLSGLPEFVRIQRTSSDIARPYEVRDLNRVLADLDAGVLYSPYHALAPLRVGRPVVVAVHDCILEADRRLTGGRAKSVAYRVNTERVLRQAAAVVTPSEATGAVLPTFYGRVPPVVVCRNGVDVPSWAASPDTVARARAELGLPERFVLHVGARRLHKNQEILLRALPALPPDVHLVLLGHRDPRVVDPVDALIAELGVADRVRQLDDLTDAQLRGLYGAASLFAFPSTAEGFGLPPLEAMAAGVPVVASAIPVLAEVLRDAALFASPYSSAQWADRMNAVLGSAALTAELQQKGRHVAGSATWHEGAANLFHLLAHVADGRPASDFAPPPRPVLDLAPV